MMEAVATPEEVVKEEPAPSVAQETTSISQTTASESTSASPPETQLVQGNQTPTEETSSPAQPQPEATQKQDEQSSPMTAEREQQLREQARQNLTEIGWVPREPESLKQKYEEVIDQLDVEKLQAVLLHANAGSRVAQEISEQAGKQRGLPAAEQSALEYRAPAELPKLESADVDLIAAAAKDRESFWFGSDDGKSEGLLHNYLRMTETTNPDFVSAKQKVTDEVLAEYADRAGKAYDAKPVGDLTREQFIQQSLANADELREMEIDQRWKAKFTEMVQQRVAEMKAEGVDKVFAEIGGDSDVTETSTTPSSTTQGEGQPEQSAQSEQGATPEPEKKKKKWSEKMKETLATKGYQYLEDSIQGSSFETFIDALMSADGFGGWRSGSQYYTERANHPENVFGYNAFREECLQQKPEKGETSFGVGVSILLNKVYERAEAVTELKLKTPDEMEEKEVWEGEGTEHLQIKIKSFYEFISKLIQEDREEQLVKLLSEEEVWGKFFKENMVLANDLIVFFKLAGNNDQEFARLFGGEKK